MMQQPMGLQALLQRPQKSQQADIPSGMKTLIAAQKLQEMLRSQAAPVTPDGRPTIAGVMEQQLAQQAQPQGMPQGMSPPQPNPQMQPQGPGTVAQAAQAAGIAGQQQQAQQQQAMQQAMQMAQQQQQQPQMMARGGLASLPAENIARMKYAQGGVIGYSSRGYVDPLGQGTAAEGEEEPDIKPSRSAMLAMPLAAAIDAAQSPLNFIRRLMAANGQDVSMTPAIDVLRKWEQAKQEEKKEEPQKPVDYSGMDHPRVTPMLPPMPGRSAAPVARPSAPAAPAAGPAQAAMPTNPDLEFLRQLGKKEFTDVAPTPQSYMQTQEEFRKARGLSGPIGSAIEEAMKRAEARSAETKAAYEQGIQGRGLENLISSLAAGARSGRAGGLGAQYVANQQANQQADMNFRQLMDASAEKRDQMAATVQSMREAAAANDEKNFRSELNLYRQQKRDHDSIQRQLAGTAAQVSTTMQEGALNRASQERMNAQRLAMHAQEMGQNKLAAQLTAANHEVDRAQETVSKTLQKEFPMAAVWAQDPAAAQKDPAYKLFLDRKQQLEEQHLARPKQLRQHLSNKILGDESGAGPITQYDRNGNRIP